MTKLIICEKPAAALKIATALADKKFEKKSDKGVYYYILIHKKKKVIVACAVGHLYGLVEKDKKGWGYPVFDIEWRAVHEFNKGAAFTKKYLDNIKRLCKGADEFYLATDKDIEGETLGYNILRFACNQKDAKRMEFSTLTKEDLVNAFEHPKEHVDFPLIEAGETRHFLDHYWGVNLSRALTLAVKTTGRFKILSSGRVQGPALKLIVDREIEIRNFKPIPYWEIQLLGNIKRNNVGAWHKEGKFLDRKKANLVIENTKGKSGVISDIKKVEFKQKAPYPFDLTTLQLEAYRIFKMNPKKTLEIAQNLYLMGVISYPRTSSQQLPGSLNLKNILKLLSKQKDYKELCNELLKENLKPNNGGKTDPAHPALHATGESPEKLNADEVKLYDLIVRRTLATFAEDAVRETVSIDINVNNEIFISKGTRTIKEGWHKFYKYVSLEEQRMPDVDVRDKVKVKEINLLDKETQPPKRYTPASIIKDLSKKNLGTKSTRSEIIDTLYQRHYIKDQGIIATQLGIKTVETLKKYSPKILDEGLTRHFEKNMELIQEGKLKKEKVLEEAQTILTEILTDFRKKEKEIGEKLLEASEETADEINTVGKCKECGGDLKIMYSPKIKSKFIGCSSYPDCKSVYNLPSNGLVKTTEKICKECGYPIILVIRKGRRPQEVCINDKCPSKELTKEEQKIAKEEKVCSKCGKGKMVLRKSVYGSFLACNKFPKCRNIENINGDRRT